MDKPNEDDYQLVFAENNDKVVRTLPKLLLQKYPLLSIPAVSLDSINGIGVYLQCCQT